MEDIGFKVSPEIADYLRNKGYVEICLRDAASHFSKFSKCAISMASEHRNDILDTSRSVIASCGGIIESVINFGSELLRHHDILEVRHELAALENQQAYTNELLDAMIQELTINYSSLESIQKQQWLLQAISTANLEATQKGNAIICKKLDSIIECLDYIGKQVDLIRDIEYETRIYQPCQDLVTQYQTIAFELKRNRIVPESKMIDAINQKSVFLRSAPPLSG